jgi:hypothetical protein
MVAFRRLPRPMARWTRLIALGALLAGVLLVAGCGGTSSVATTEGTATDEGTYLEMGGLKYQIQISRYLNPSDAEDRDYLIGLPHGVRPASDELWFGVFMRVENDSSSAQRAASDYTITDTQGHTFRPVPLNSTNVFAYHALTLQPTSKIPVPDSAAGFDPIQGSLILFRLKEEYLQNRPLILHISQGASGPSVSTEIDL